MCPSFRNATGFYAIEKAEQIWNTLHWEISEEEAEYDDDDGGGWCLMTQGQRVQRAPEERERQTTFNRKG